MKKRTCFYRKKKLLILNVPKQGLSLGKLVGRSEDGRAYWSMARFKNIDVPGNSQPHAILMKPIPPQLTGPI